MFLSCQVAIAKFSNRNYFEVVKLPIYSSRRLQKKFLAILILKDKLLLPELKILNYDGLWENKKNNPGEIRCFDWKKLID